MNTTKLILILFVFFLPFLFANDHRKVRRGYLEVPNPKQDIEACNTEEGVNFCDPENILSDEIFREFKDLQKKLKEAPLEANGGKCSVYEVGFVVLKAMDEAGVQDTENMCHNILINWNIGDPICRNGALVLFSLDDNVYHICEVRRKAVCEY